MGKESIQRDKKVLMHMECEYKSNSEIVNEKSSLISWLRGYLQSFGSYRSIPILYRSRYRPSPHLSRLSLSNRPIRLILHDKRIRSPTPRLFSTTLIPYPPLPDRRIEQHGLYLLSRIPSSTSRRRSLSNDSTRSTQYLYLTSFALENQRGLDSRRIGIE